MDDFAIHRKLKFKGSLVEIKKIIREKGFIGKWKEELISTGTIKHIFSSNDGGVLSWFASKTVVFQGTPKDSQKLLNHMMPYLQEEERVMEIETVRSEDEYDE